METTNRPGRPDRLEIFLNDLSDRAEDHMETRLQLTRDQALFSFRFENYVIENV